MKRIIIHWTGGRLQPNATDFQHYHFLINGDGIVINGKFPVSANEKCKVNAKNEPLYAMHTGQGNTGSIGVAMCGMFLQGNSDLKTSTDLLTKVQCERCWKLCAELCKMYKISIDEVYTHYSFNQKKNIQSSKIDIVYLPPYPELKPNEIENFIRNKVNWYLKTLN